MQLDYRNVKPFELLSRIRFIFSKNAFYIFLSLSTMFFTFGFAKIAVCQTISPEILDRSERRLNLFIKVSNPEVEDFAAAVGYIFAMEYLDTYFKRDANGINLFFVSQIDAIKNGKIDLKNFTMFTKAAIGEIARIETDTDECFVQSFYIDNGREIIIAVNSTENGPSDLDKKCFLLALGLFAGRSLETLNDFTDMDLSESVKVGRLYT